MKFRPCQPLSYLLLAAALLFIEGEPMVAQDAGKALAKLEALGFQVFKTPVVVKDFSLQPLGSTTKESIPFASFKGKVVLLNFWATWCPPCKAEMPSIQRLWEKEKGKAFAIVAVSEGEAPSTVSAFISSNHYSYPIYLDSPGSLGDRFGVKGIPTTYVFNKEGLAVARIVGSREYDDPALIAALEELMAAPGAK